MRPPRRRLSSSVAASGRNITDQPSHAPPSCEQGAVQGPYDAAQLRKWVVALGGRPELAAERRAFAELTVWREGGQALPLAELLGMLS